MVQHLKKGDHGEFAAFDGELIVLLHKESQDSLTSKLSDQEKTKLDELGWRRKEEIDRDERYPKESGAWCI